MRKKILFAAVALLLSAPMYAQYVMTGCGKTADLPLNWEGKTPAEKQQWLENAQEMLCGEGWGGSAWIEKGERPAPSTEPDN